MDEIGKIITSRPAAFSRVFVTDHQVGLREIEMGNFFIPKMASLGCGFDFRLWTTEAGDYFAVEVKGLAERTGSISLTPKEHEVAAKLSERYFLFVVKNFRESSCHAIYRNPLRSDLEFTKKERLILQVSWFTNA